MKLTGQKEELLVRFHLERDSQVIKGFYVYEGIEQAIMLQGRIEKNRTKLEELTAGCCTGRFDLIWTSSEGLQSLEGSWTSPDGKRKATVSAEQQDYRLSRVKLRTILIKSSPKALLQEHASYPQFLGDESEGWKRINQEIAALVARSGPVMDDSESLTGDYDLGYNLHFAKDRLLSLSFTEWVCVMQTAHPSTGTITMTFDPATGRPIPLAWFFKDGSAFEDQIIAEAIATLRLQQAREGSPAVEDFLTEDRIGGYAPTLRGFEITFVLPHAMGDTYTVLIPYAKLKHILSSAFLKELEQK